MDSFDDNAWIVWLAAKRAVNHHDIRTTGELLVIQTIVLLDTLGVHLSVTDLVRLTGLPKSNISRYISAQVNKGMLTENIDPSDRRMRILVPTEKGQNQRSEHRKVAQDIERLVSRLKAEKPDKATIVEMLATPELGDDKMGR